MWNVPNRNFGLDVIRALAILLVIVSHCTYILPEFNQTITDGIRLLGATGVDIFFVLSGYLIGGILLKYLESGKTKFKDLFHFWKRRWLRTLPNYIVVLIINTVLAIIFTRNLPTDVWIFIPFLQNFFTEHPDFFTEAWSLSIEEYAYVVLPIIIYGVLFVSKIRASKLFLILTLTVIFILFIFKLEFYLSTDISDYKSWSLNFRKVVIYRLDAIYYGFLLVYLMSKCSFLEKNKTKLLFLGVSLFLILHLFIVLFNILPNTQKAFYVFAYLPLMSLSIAVIFPFMIKIRITIFARVITYISTRSYSLYLVNYSIILLTLEHFLEPSVSTVILYLILTFIISEVLYRYIEIPFLRLRHKIVPRN